MFEIFKNIVASALKSCKNEVKKRINLKNLIMNFEQANTQILKFECTK